MNNIEIVDENSVLNITEKQNQVAKACSQIVESTAVSISNKKYVCVEGWQAIAVAHNCFAGSDNVEEVFRNGDLVGWKARGYIKRGDTIISTAEGFCGADEKIGKIEYSGRAMAQTRAISRACRSAFAHIVVLINKDLNTTPAEEVPAGGFNNTHSYSKPPPKQAFNSTQYSGSGNGLATNKQVEFIQSLLKNDSNKIQHLLKYYNKTSLVSLTINEAGDAITKIRAQQKQATVNA